MVNIVIVILIIVVVIILGESGQMDWFSVVFFCAFVFELTVRVIY